MNTVDLVRIAKGDPVLAPFFGGVFPADLLLDVVPAYPSALIANTDTHTGSGKHWVAFYFTSGGNGEFFDSYGHSPGYYHRSWMKWIQLHSATWIYNRRRIQSTLSTTCGLHSLFFLYHRCAGLSMKDVQRLYTRDKFFNDQMAEEDLESHTHKDIVIKNEDFIINQLSRALNDL